MTMTTCMSELFAPSTPPPPAVVDAPDHRPVNTLLNHIQNTCDKLAIPADPWHWTLEDSMAWLDEVASEMCMPTAAAEHLYMRGAQLCALHEHEVVQRAPFIGHNVHSKLLIWKTDEEMYVPQTQPSVLPYTMMPTLEWGAYLQPSTDRPPPPSSTTTNDTPPSMTMMMMPKDELMCEAQFSQLLAMPRVVPSSTSMSKTPMRPIVHTGSAHNIHLWQFLRELLDERHMPGYQAVLRWIDRKTGTFKIENSHELARLWGVRKNRCKMNYDKLSRSLRQYYKKGILRKTGQRQRLIYQFCAPYNALLA